LASRLKERKSASAADDREGSLDDLLKDNGRDDRD